MKHYTSTELIYKMAYIGYLYNFDASHKGYISFRGTDGWTTYPLAFSTWKEVAVWYADACKKM